MAFSNYNATKSNDSNKRLGQDNISESLRNELIQVNGELTEATIQYFKYQFIVDCVKKFLDQNVKKKIANEELAILSDPFYLTFVKKYSHADGIKAFGISEDFIDKTIKKHKKSQDEKEELNKFVTNEIDNFCIKITQYAGHAQRYGKNKQRAFQEAVKDLTSQIDDLADAKIKLETDKKDLNDLRTNYFEYLVQGVSMLKTLVSLHDDTIKFQSSLGELFSSKKITLASKINRFEHQVLVATYNDRSVQALTKIRDELDQKKVAVDNNLNSTNAELQTYCVLGPEYEKLVEEYSELLRKIRNHKWALQSLNRRQSFGGSLCDKDLMTRFDEEEGETSSSQIVEISNCSVLNETSDYSALNETSYCSVLNETSYCSVFNETSDCSALNETLNCSTMVEKETSDNSRSGKIKDNSTFGQTMGISNVD